MSLCTMKEKDYLNCISFETSLQCKKEKKKKKKKEITDLYMQFSFRNII